MKQPMFDRIDERVAQGKEISDGEYFDALRLKLEYLTKIVVCGVTVCIGDDKDRHRYSLEHKLVRSGSMGGWTRALDDALAGLAVRFLIPEARVLAKDLTEKVGPEDWRHSAVIKLDRAATALGMKSALTLGQKVSLRHFFAIAVEIRNDNGHGAATATQRSAFCLDADDALTIIVQNLALFRLPWAYLHQTHSGKYRVSSLLNDSSKFDRLKKTRDARLPDGVYFYPNNQESSNPIHVPLIFSDPEVHDIALPNGKHHDRDHSFEALSYVTNTRTRQDGSAWAHPKGSLPPSETEGKAILETLGNIISNAPDRPAQHVSRRALEQSLLNVLENPERHAVVTLTGPGGIGKTATALTVIHQIAHYKHPPYETILWISARDIDLLESGPKPVSQKVIQQRDISRFAAELLEVKERNHKDFKLDEFFGECLRKGALETTLFVFDNFETMQNPVDVFTWIDCHIRHPNKALITTRYRDFRGDYPIEISGMEDDEAGELIKQHASHLNIEGLLDSEYKRQLIDESEGHPYVIKILLGQVSKEKKVSSPERIIETSDKILDALFKRTFDAFGPSAKRVFLLLSSWKVFVPQLAVEAILLRPGGERLKQVSEAIEELLALSFIEKISSEKDKKPFLGVSLAAATYGRSRLKVSPFRESVEADREILMQFGASERGGIRMGVYPRIVRFMESVKKRAHDNLEVLDEHLPLLEYLASKVPDAYIDLADLFLGIDYQSGQTKGKEKERAKGYVQSFLEKARQAKDLKKQKLAWKCIERICKMAKDVEGEIEAIRKAALLSRSSQADLSLSAAHLNSRLREIKDQGYADLRSESVRENLLLVADALEKRRGALSAADCSILAWLYLNASMNGKALDAAKFGIERDPKNHHCQNLIKKLEA